ncbi:zinc-dependent alcohol dehydrogenase [Paenibacillus plantarum]|nr:alcohol dehydrogenase catalytic domain-containing protein [Paenibacillus plantarum]
MQKQIWEWTGYNAMTTRTTERERSLEKDQVEVRIKSIGICGTDLHIMEGHTGFSQPPLPLGHELAGVVERIGDGVVKWKVGDRVCIDPLIGCGKCQECLVGHKHRCRESGEIGLQFPGGWQEFLVMPSTNLYKLPDSISFAEATQAETIHCCLGGVDKLTIQLGQNVSVIGDGPTGLYYVQLLKAAGAGKVSLIGMREKRLELGIRLGADAMFNLRAHAAPLAAETEDIVIDAAGTESSLRLSIELLKKGGQLLLFGLPGEPILVDIQTVVLKELTLLGSTNAPQVWLRVIEMMASGSVQVKPLITQYYEFNELDKAVEFARNEPDEVVKVIVNHK